MSINYEAILNAVLASPKWKDMGGLGADTMYGDLAIDVAKAAVAESTKWQPIETAPKDGKDILVWEYGAWIARWIEIRTRPELGCWSSEDGAVDNPTHWMPLPSPPEEGK